jgi:ABC-2 type transport system ATP-binding protein
MTVVYTSHYMEEVETLCDRVAIIDHGKVIAQGTIAELKRLVGDESVVSVDVEGMSAEALDAASAVPGVTRATQADDRLEALAPDPGTALPLVLAALAKAGAKVHSVEVREPNLESVFLHLTGKRLRD